MVKYAPFRTAFLVALLCVVIFPSLASANSERIIIENDGWELVGNWLEPTHTSPVGVVLLLHKAAGDRSAYDKMADLLASRGYASLRLDLRGHGESTNIRAFDPNISRFENPNDPAVVENFALIRQGHFDIEAAMKWLGAHSDISTLPFAVVSSSYTGEQMASAETAMLISQAFVALSPGNFSAQSVAKIDPSGKPWLFIRAEEEMSFMDDIFATIENGSEAEIWVLPGRGHATDLLEVNPTLDEQILEWLDRNLQK